MPAYFGLYLLFNIIGSDSQRGTCEGRAYGCCSGTIWNETQKRCTECRPGYIGEFCNITCHHPHYGIGCLEMCSPNDSKDLYDFRTGCRNEDSRTGEGNTKQKDAEKTTLVYMQLKTSDAYTDFPLQHRYSSLKITVIALSVIVFVILVVYFLFNKFPNVEKPKVGHPEEENSPYEDVQNLHVHP